MKLDLGCGQRKKEGWIGIDSKEYPGVDYVLNIGKDKMPFENDSIDEIRSIHVFEHLYSEELFFCMEECFRIIKPTGTLYIEVPKANTPAFYAHPDHKIAFMPITFGFWQVPAYGKDVHGYLKGFWNVRAEEKPESVEVFMYPNKPGGKFDYVEVYRGPLT